MIKVTHQRIPQRIFLDISVVSFIVANNETIFDGGCDTEEIDFRSYNERKLLRCKSLFTLKF